MSTCRLKLLATALAFTGAVSLAAPTAVAVDEDPPGLFELDGNPQDGGPAAGEDWELLYNGGANDGGGGNSVAFTAIVPDPAPQTIYFQGGSKDPNPIFQWNWKNGSTPNKDNITNAFAAAYINPSDICVDFATGTFSNGTLIAGTTVDCLDAGAAILHAEGDLIIYFGMDIFDNEGDKFSGFWFFQDDVGPQGGPGDGFAGAHVIGDILVVVNFPQSAAGVPEVRVAEWNPALQDVANNLHLLAESATAECDSTDGQSTLFCAIINDPGGNTSVAGTVPLIWPYVDGDGISPTGFYSPESFVSGGINVTQLLGGATPCISTFQAETRASRSFSAKLWDFVNDSFDVCGIDVTKSCDADISTDGDLVTVTYNGNVTNTGALDGEVTILDSEDNSEILTVCIDDPLDINGLCGDAGDTNIDVSCSFDAESNNRISATCPIAAGETLAYEGMYEVAGPVTSLDFSDSVTADLDIGGEVVSSDSDTADCSAPETLDLNVTKNCTPMFLGGDTFQADIDGTFTNDGNVKMVNVALSDTVFSSGELTIVWPGTSGELLPGQSGSFTATFTSTSATSHENTITVSGDSAITGTPDSDNASTFAAQCSIAPNPNLELVKECDTTVSPTGVRLVVDGGELVVEVDTVITLSNGVGDEDVDNITVSDNQADLVHISGGSGWSCVGMSCAGGRLDVGEVATFEQTYRPAGATGAGDLDSPDTVIFQNIASASGQGVLSAIPVTPPDDDANCSLCQ